MDTATSDTITSIARWLAGVPEYDYAVFDEYGSLFPFTIRDTKEEAETVRQAMVAKSAEKHGEQASEYGLCVGKFKSEDLRCSVTGDTHERVEYVEGFRAVK